MCGDDWVSGEGDNGHTYAAAGNDCCLANGNANRDSDPCVHAPANSHVHTDIVTTDCYANACPAAAYADTAPHRVTAAACRGTLL